MSTEARNLAIAAFRAAAEDAYETGSKLRGTVMEISGVMAETQRFPVIGVTDSVERQSQGEVVPANIGNAKPTATLRPRERFEFLDTMDRAITNVDLMRGYGRACGKSVARQFDEDIIKVLSVYDGTAYSRPGLAANVATITTGASQKIGAADIAKAVAMLMDEDVGAEDPESCTFAFAASEFENLATDELLSSMDYVQGRVTESARFGKFYGCMPVSIGQANRREGHGKFKVVNGKPVAYVYAKNSVGLAVGTVENMSVVEWMPSRRSWMVGAETLAGATRIQNAGIVEIQLKT